MSYRPLENTDDKTYIQTASEFVSGQVEGLRNSLSTIPTYLPTPSIPSVFSTTTTPATQSTIPDPPHGQAPSDSGPGFVADEDKTLTMKVGENLESITGGIRHYSTKTVDTLYASADSLTQQVSRGFETLGILSKPAESTIPDPPHGQPPSDSGPGFVAYEDKNLMMKASDNWEALKGSIQDLGKWTVDGIWRGGEQKEGERAVPAPPHGRPPSDSQPGYVAEQDKSLAMKVGENLEELKGGIQDLSNKTVETLYAGAEGLGQTLSKGFEGLGVLANPADPVIPEPPHGRPPSDSQPGSVAEQDKSLTMKVGENWEALKDATQQTWNETKQGLQDLTNQATGKIVGQRTGGNL